MVPASVVTTVAGKAGDSGSTSDVLGDKTDVSSFLCPFECTDGIFVVPSLSFLLFWLVYFGLAQLLFFGYFSGYCFFGS